MTTRDDLHDTHDAHDLEARLRVSLRNRAADVDVTPALHERVRRQAVRGTWLRRGFAVAVAAGTIAVAAMVVPGLLPDQPLQPDVADTPEEVLPTDGPSTSAGPDLVPAQLAAQLFDAGVAYATDDGSGGSVLQVGGRTLVATQPIASLDAARLGDGTVLVAGFADGSLGVVEVGGVSAAFDRLVDADANGAKGIVTPGVDGIAWIEGTDLHVLPFGSDVRVLPLEGDVPPDLEIEDWVAQADAQVVLASQPGGTVWSIPMDDSSVFDTAPTDPAFVLPRTPPAATDVAITPDLSTWVTVPADGPQPARLERVDGEVVLLDDAFAGQLAGSTDPVLTTLGNRATLHDRASGATVVLELPTEPPVDGPPVALRVTSSPLTAVAPIGAAGADEADVDATSGTSVADLAATPVPVVGTSGTDLVVEELDGSRSTIPVYASAESEASLGVLDVQPDGTRDGFVVAYANYSEGEASVRFARVVADQAELTGGIAVVGTDPDLRVTGIAWSPDGRSVAWSTSDGVVGWAEFDPADGLAVVETGTLPELAGDDATVIGWDPPEDDTADSAVTGQLQVAHGGAGGALRTAEVLRAADGSLTAQVVAESLGLMARVAQDEQTPASVGLVDAQGDLRFTWSGNLDQTGSLTLPDAVVADPTTWVELTLAGHDGSVVVSGGPQGAWWWIRLVGDTGELTELTDATAWTPLG